MKIFHLARQWAADIRFWIAFFFTVRLVGITNPPLEGAHNWRQSLTNMIARNYYENQTSFLYPMIDMGGERSGVIGSEFPFFNWLIYLVSLPFGFEHWYGRLINLFVSSIGIYFFYRLVKVICSHKLAFHATLLLLVSIWFSFSRKIMPDTFSVSLVMIGLYYGYCYLKDGRYLHLFVAFSCVTLGVLSKIPAVSLLAFLPILPFMRIFTMKRIMLLYATAFGSLFIVSGWYFYWVPNLIAKHKFELYFPKSLREGFVEVSQHLPDLFEKFYFSAFFSFFAFGVCIVGLLYVILFANKWLKLALLLVCIVFTLFIFKTGAVFPTHSYYIIPLVPVLSLIAAHFTSQLNTKWASVVLSVIVIESIANQQHDFFIKEASTYKLKSETIADRYIPKNSTIIINGGLSPQSIYFLNRKGWSLDNEQLAKHGAIDSLSQLGANYMIIDKTNQVDLVFEGKILFEDAHFKIYRLTN